MVQESKFTKDGDVIIKWGSFKTKIVDIPFNEDFFKEVSETLKGSAQESNLSPNTSKVLKTTAKILPAVVPTTSAKIAVRGLEDLITGGNFSTENIQNETVKALNPVFRRTASKMGYKTISELMDRIKFGGAPLEGVILQEFLNKLNESSSEEYEKYVKQQNLKLQENKVIGEVDGILIKVITNYDENLASEIPLRKVEKGFDVTSHVYNKSRDLSFVGNIFDIEPNDNNAFTVKENLKKIRNSKTTFTVEIIGKEIIEKCLFESLSFTKTNQFRNGYEVNFRISSINESEIKRTIFSGVPVKTEGNTNSPDENAKQQEETEDKIHVTKNRAVDQQAIKDREKEGIK